MHRKPLRRSTWQEPEQTPIALPRAVVTVTDDGELDVTVDGTAFPPPTDGQAWTRSSFGTLLDAISEARATAVRIEVRETDGSVFTDIIRTRRRITPGPAAPESGKQGGKHATRTRTPELIEVTADGYVPGEDVAVAVIASHTDAAWTGRARTLLDKTHLDPVLRDGTGEVVLLGRISGTVHVRRLP
ncbi:hypothetical protein GSU68_07035 [Rathayibacter sp. VKM Ac-2759]|uniref:hypothetical protein n=1 Tax=Microbacteriaceae TaxID=85023 RepID=UPI0013164C83|nr:MULTISPECIES: hypothetical protein [Microbacteriaceae]QHC68453.1 hypothetical protein GSU68_07035 [Rathayibacter sp. VKM Ac-2759]